VAVPPRIVLFSRFMRTSVGVALIVASFAACSSPNSPPTKSALRARTVEANELGQGWFGARLYTHTTIAIPCISGPCSGPEPRGNAFQSSFNNSVTGADFQETVAWVSNPATVFAAIRQNAPGISQAVRVPVLRAPRIGSDEQLGLVYSEPGSYNLNYFVEKNGYIGYFLYTGPVSGAGAMEVAVKKFS
jgi:hypothetical protein